jgi:hypothetical protein
VQGQPGEPEPIVAEARRAFLNDRPRVSKTISSRSIQDRLLKQFSREG